MSFFLRLQNGKGVFMKTVNVLFLIFIMATLAYASVENNSIYHNRKYQFLSWGKIPTWVGIATDWETESPKINLYDYAKYKGHAQYASIGLSTGITYKQFKERVKDYKSRKYLPFFLFDLRKQPVEKEGRRYNWAIRIEDYGYGDTPEQMTETVLRLLNIISDYTGMEKGSKGIIVLATNPLATPNTSIAAELNRAGFLNMTLSELLTTVGGEKVNVLNPGSAVGYLKYIKAGKENEYQPSFNDIVIYEKLPTRVPPVRGIITLEPQTPLSHINLLAQNRGTINLYAHDITYIPDARQSINKLVKIECSQSRVIVSEITEKEALRFWEKNKKRVTISVPDVSITGIVDLNNEELLFTEIKHIGAKASNYARVRKNFPAYVRPGFAVPFVYYKKTIEKCGADFLIKQLLEEKHTLDEKTKILEAIRNKIESASLDSLLVKEIKELIKKEFPNSRIRLRSSTNCEDLPEFNGAGLYVSKGINSDDSDSVLIQKILKVYASLWSVRAYREREFYFIDHRKAAMSILINEAFRNEYANGVVVVMPGKEGSSILINSQSGENSVANPENGQIPEFIVFPKARSDKFKVKSKSNIADIFLQPGFENHLLKLKEVATRIYESESNHFEIKKDKKYGIDLEFKIMEMNGEHTIFIKQSRLLGVVLPE